MKTPKPLLIMLLLTWQLTSTAQVQWYQNQDAHNAPPNGTAGVSVQPFTANSFVACYQWSIVNDQFTWKISKSHINGAEQKSIFFSGTTSQLQVKAGKRNALYVMESNFPLGQSAVYTLYKLDTNLVIKAQREISFPNDFSIFNMNAFEIDGNDNIYLAGDGQYPVGPGFRPASFVIKSDNNLGIKWSHMDSVQTSYTRLHVDSRYNVWVIADFYTSFPDITIHKFSASGQVLQTKTVTLDGGRYTLLSAMDEDDNLLIYGGKFTSDTEQGIYIAKISRLTGQIVYNKTYFNSLATQLYDLRMDGHGWIYSLVSQYSGPNKQLSRVSRINSDNGNIFWSRSFLYSQDSCDLFKIVMSSNDQFYVVGEKRYHDILSRGFAMKMKKNGQTDGNFSGPDSVHFQRSHWLIDGITDRNNQLIAIGSTDGVDTTSFETLYLHSFAVKFGQQNNNSHDSRCDDRFAANTTGDLTMENVPAKAKASLYPNPASTNLIVVNPAVSEYDQLLVYSFQGGLVLQQNMSASAAAIDVSRWSSGAYLLVLRSSATKKEQSLRFVIAR
jgi:hypothetical protein